ncbi:MAG: VWA domain-containing protein [Planctomycetes bacterium]|nr:VWA domain-containing protein [Planctomycetota bacterium]
MNFRIDNPVILFGLLALAVPLVLHFLKRRRFEVIDWGAMQFLPESISIQRRRWLDEILLLLMRLGMIALIVLALATPISTSGLLGGLQDRSTRDVVLVLDGSFSMDARIGARASPWSEAVRAAKNIVGQAAPGDRFAIVIARQPPLRGHQEFSSDRDEVQAKLDQLPTARGNPDLPAALAEAWTFLQSRSRAARKEIIVFTDKQLFGFADPPTLATLEMLGQQWRADAATARQAGDAVPSVRLIGVGGALPKRVPNFSMAPVVASRNVVKVGQEITLRSAVRVDGFDKYARPGKVTLALDGKAVHEFVLPDKADLKTGQIPLNHALRFAREGRHVVSFILQSEAPDVLAADNEQHAVVEVVKDLRVLLVDGDRKLGPDSSTFFLQRALSAPAVGVEKFQKNLTAPGATSVLVLADVPRLEPAQNEAIERFLAEGGAVLIALGERMRQTRAFYNHQLHRDGKGWLPAQLLEVDTAADGTLPDVRSFQHPALELFRTGPEAGMKSVRFEKWWQVQIARQSHSVPIARFANGDPFLIEMPYKKGRVMLCTVPLDRRWGSTFPGGAEFPVLVNELIHYLAGAGETRAMLRRGEPIRLQLADAATRQLKIKTPEDNLTLEVKAWPWTHANTGAVGVYWVRASDGAAWPFVVAPDLRESDLTPCTEFDLRKVRDRLPIAWLDEESALASIIGDDERSEELWWLLLTAVLGLLCMEVWMTRRMALARGG